MQNESRERLAERYKRSRDYSRLLAMPEFQRLVQEKQSDNSATIENMAHKYDENEHDKLVEIRYWNGIVSEVAQAARLLPSLESQLEAAGIVTEPEL